MKGTHNEAAESLSRHQHRPPSAGDDLAEYDTEGNLASTLALSITPISASASDPLDTDSLHLHKLWRPAAEIQEYQAFKETILGGFPNQKASLKEPMKTFWSVKDNLSVDDDLIVYGCCLYIVTATMLS